MEVFGPGLPTIFTISTIKDLFQLASDRRSCVENLVEIGILKPKTCCRGITVLGKCESKDSTDGYIWRCQKCKKKFRLRPGSFFAASNLSLEDLLVLIFCWAHKLQVSATVSITGISKKTVIDWYSRIREVCSSVLVKRADMFQLGGPGTVVQIDETVVAKRKYERGRKVPSQWVFGIYDTSSKYGYIRLVDRRDAGTLLPLITRFVKAGTTIYSDEWRAYIGLREIEGINPPYIHQTVNHSKQFVDPVTGACTNAVEAYWSRLKRSTRYAGTRETIPSLCDEFMWRERFGQRGLLPWRSILIHIANK